MIHLSFVNGIGGHWLRQLILAMPIDTKTGNFHVKRFPNDVVFISHELKNFDYLYYGEHWFNFYLNQIYKLHHIERNIFATKSYKECFMQCMTVASLLKFRPLADQAFFKFEDLLFDTDKFLKCVHHVQDQLQIEKISQEFFLAAREKFFSTCVEARDIYNNVDNTFWICYALGELQSQGLTPGNFIVADLKNRDLCLDYIHQHRHNLKQSIPIYQFNSGVVMPQFPTV